MDSATDKESMTSSDHDNGTSEQPKRCEKYNLRRSSLRTRVQTETSSQPKEKEEKAKKEKGAEGGGGGGGGRGKGKKTKTRPPPLSKYRRRSANARERCRMAEINEAFDNLKSVLPQHGLELMAGAEASGSDDSLHSTPTISTKGSRKGCGKGGGVSGGGSGGSVGGGGGGRGANKNQPTKITVLRLAINYIAALADMLQESDNSASSHADITYSAKDVTYDVAASSQSHNNNLLYTNNGEVTCTNNNTLAYTVDSTTLPAAHRDSLCGSYSAHCGAGLALPPPVIHATTVPSNAALTNSGSSNAKTPSACSKAKNNGGRKGASKRPMSRSTSRRREPKTKDSAADVVASGVGVASSVDRHAVTGYQDVIGNTLNDLSLAPQPIYTDSVLANATVRDSMEHNAVSARKDSVVCSKGISSSVCDAGMFSKDDVLAGVIRSADGVMTCKDTVLSTGGYLHRGDLHLGLDLLVCNDDLGSDAASTTTTTPSRNSGDEESLLSSPTSDMDVVGVGDLDFFAATLSADFSPDLSPDFTATLSPEEEMCLELVASVL